MVLWQREERHLFTVMITDRRHVGSQHIISLYGKCIFCQFCRGRFHSNFIRIDTYTHFRSLMSHLWIDSLKYKINANEVDRWKTQKGQDRAGGRLTKHAKMHICRRIEASRTHKHHSHALPTNTHSVILHPSVCSVTLSSPTTQFTHCINETEIIIYLHSNGFGNPNCDKVACSTCLKNSLTPLSINVDKFSLHL